MKGKFDKKMAVHICLFMVLLCLVSVKVVFASAREISNDASEMTTTAMDPPAIPAVDFKETGSLLMMSLKVIGSLGLVIGLMLLLIFWFRKLGLAQGSGKSGSLIKVLDTRMVAHKKYVSVLNIAGDFVVIGISEQQINMLTTLENSGELLDYARSNEKDGSASPTFSFASLLKKAGPPLKGPKQQD
ncbi:MAG: flagellar biosynthetic protein FliO [Thermodesulfobacteriota bacterium]|nr:flagellar biosynthetic protein FliO [Thermodesulfobacteriota bacterium]